MPAPAGGLFTPSAFEGQVGKRVSIRAESGDMAVDLFQATVLCATVAPGGLSAQITMEADPASATLVLRAFGGFTGDDS